MKHRYLAYSVRLKSLTQISTLCCKAVCFDGSEALIPSNQIYGKDYDISKCDAYWISAWILDKKNIQYSDKKKCYFDENKNQLPYVKIEKYTPEKKNILSDNIVKELKK